MFFFFWFVFVLLVFLGCFWEFSAALAAGERAEVERLVAALWGETKGGERVVLGETNVDGKLGWVVLLCCASCNACVNCWTSLFNASMVVK